MAAGPVLAILPAKTKYIFKFRFGSISVLNER
jgi:hypothetical protein